MELLLQNVFLHNVSNEVNLQWFDSNKQLGFQLQCPV